jgi:hypothetical protein
MVVACERVNAAQHWRSAQIFDLMEMHAPDILRISVALLVGGVIGLAFGLAQDAARPKHELMQQKGEFTGRMSAVPGSAKRVALLMIGLIAVQWICPLLFARNTQWWVTGGVLLGYGSQLARGIMIKRREMKN